MTNVDYKKAAIHRVVPRLLATLLATLGVSLLSSAAVGQGLSVNLTDEFVPALDASSHSIRAIDSEFSAYDRRQVEQLEDLGRASQSDGEFQQALVLFKQALHVARINNGLYHESQIPIVDDIISAEIALRNWESVNKYYAYQEHLYKRLYNLHDPRLEAGLRKVSAWHVNALNVNLDGKRIEHLRKANNLFKLRMQIAENTLSQGDPTFAVLAENIEICERELFLASDLNREMMVRKKKNDQFRRQSYRQNQSRLVTRD